MSRMISCVVGAGVALALAQVTVLCAAEVGPMKDRVARMKKSVVRVVAGQSVGTGFIVSADGLIATNSHVIRTLSQVADGKVTVSEASTITVQFADGHTVPAQVHASSRDSGLQESVARDYVVLEIKEKGLVPLRLGTYADADEGADVYLAGFPLGINQIVVARGLLSTKWNHPRLGDVAWLDIGMNKGNSGGPVLLFGSKPEEDSVVGIATFNLNPFANPAEELRKQAETFPTGIFVAGIDMPAFGRLVGEALATNSLKVGGLVGIDYLKRTLPKVRTESHQGGSLVPTRQLASIEHEFYGVQHDVALVIEFDQL